MDLSNYKQSNIRFLEVKTFKGNKVKEYVNSIENKKFLVTDETNEVAETAPWLNASKHWKDEIENYCSALTSVGYFISDNKTYLVFYYNKVTSVMEVANYLSNTANTSSKEVSDNYCAAISGTEYYSKDNNPFTIKFHKYHYQDRLRKYKDESYFELIKQFKEKFNRYSYAYHLLCEQHPEQFKKELEELSKYV
jgi:hypothetical protein